MSDISTFVNSVFDCFDELVCDAEEEQQLPPMDVLEEVSQVLLNVSTMREEGRFPSFRVCFIEPESDFLDSYIYAHVLLFKNSIEFNVSELHKLAPALNAGMSYLMLNIRERPFRIIGVIASYTMWEKIKKVIASLGLSAVILILSFVYGFGTASLGFFGKVVPFIGVIMSAVMMIQVFRSIGKGSAAASATLQADGDVKKALGTARILIDSFVLAAAVVYASVLMIIRPVNDLHYYVAAMLIFAGIIFGYIGILRRYNLACTRPIPEYHERGK